MLETFQAQGSNLVNEQELTDPTGRRLTQKFDFNILTQQKSTYRLQDICLSDADLLKSDCILLCHYKWRRSQNSKTGYDR